MGAADTHVRTHTHTHSSHTQFIHALRTGAHFITSSSSSSHIASQHTAICNLSLSPSPSVSSAFTVSFVIFHKTLAHTLNLPAHTAQLDSVLYTRQNVWVSVFMCCATVCSSSYKCFFSIELTTNPSFIYRRHEWSINQMVIQ